MQELIWRAHLWVRAFLPSWKRGRHRAACRAASSPRTPASPVPVSSVLSADWPSGLFDDELFRDPVFDGELDMVRPYVLLHEERQERMRQERMRQGERRRAFGLSLDGMDIGTRCVHGAEVAP